MSIGHLRIMIFWTLVIFGILFCYILYGIFLGASIERQRTVKDLLGRGVGMRPQHEAWSPSAQALREWTRRGIIVKGAKEVLVVGACLVMGLRDGRTLGNEILKPSPSSP